MPESWSPPPACSQKARAGHGPVGRCPPSTVLPPRRPLPSKPIFLVLGTSPISLLEPNLSCQAHLTHYFPWEFCYADQGFGF